MSLAYTAVGLSVGASRVLVRVLEHPSPWPVRELVHDFDDEVGLQPRNVRKYIHELVDLGVLRLVRGKARMGTVTLVPEAFARLERERHEDAMRVRELALGVLDVAA